MTGEGLCNVKPAFFVETQLAVSLVGCFVFVPAPV